jgi:hypothetical protein
MSDLDIRVDIAPDAEPDGDQNDWLWRDISSYRRQSGDVEINYGRNDEASEVEAGDATATFSLRDGLLSPRNPTSELYGRIGPNTPIRYRLRIVEDTFNGRTVASGWGTASDGHTWSATAAHSVSGGAGLVAITAANNAREAYLTDAGALDTDTIYSVSLSAVTTGQPWISALLLRRSDASNQYRVHTELKPAGVVTIKLTRVEDGSITDIIEDLTTAATYSAGTKVWTRVQVDGGILRAKVWSGVLADQPDAWNIWSTLVRLEAGGIGLYQWRFAGNTNVGTLTASIDDLTVDALLWAGNVPEWPPRWDKSGQDSTISLTAAGPFRRLDQGEEATQSPLALQLPRYDPAGYWRLEDGSEATTAASGIPGGIPAYISGVTFGDEDCPGGASSAMKLAGTGTYNFRGQITGNTTGNFAALFFIKFASLPAGTNVIEWRTRGTVRRWVIRAISTGWQVKVYDAIGDLLYDGGTILYVDAPTEWTAVQLEVAQNGSAIDWTLVWNRVGSGTFWASGDSVPASTSVRLTDVLIPSTVGTVDALISHIWAGTNDLPFVTTSFLAVSSGYVGELASDRIQRLFDEKGSPVSISPGASEPLGRQRPGKFLELVRESAKGDIGTLYERLGMSAFLPRARRLNGPVRMVLDWSAGELAEAPQPTDDDQRLRNRWRVSRTGGSEATAENTESIAKHGLVSDATEVNIEVDSRLRPFAEWFTHLTTYDELRWPSIEIDLIANPHLIPQFLTCRIGSRIQVTNPKDQVGGVTIDLIIEGVKQVIGRTRWDVTVACSPALPWQVGVYDDTTKRYDSRSTTLNAGYDGDDTTMVVTFPRLGDAWSQVSEPYLWDVAGETIRVTSMGAITGTFGAYTQTATVDRSVNGVIKSQLAGTLVHVHPSQLARYAP